MSTPECTCKIEDRIPAGPVRTVLTIVYCPLHEAAPGLLKIAEDLASWLRNDEGPEVLGNICVDAAVIVKELAS